MSAPPQPTRKMPGLSRMRWCQLRGASNCSPLRGSRMCTVGPGARSANGSGGGSGLVPQPARMASSASGLRGSARMRPKVHLFQALAREVRVQLSGRDVRVSEHLLNRTQVATARQEMRRKRVAQRVRAHAICEACGGRVAADDLVEALAGERLAAEVDE